MRNSYKVLGDKTVIYVMGKGELRECFVSTSDLGKLLNFDVRWYAYWDKTVNNFYVRNNRQERGVWKSISLHRFLLEPNKDKQVDHIDRNTLNNRRDNLRIVSNAENAQNRKAKSNKKVDAPRGVSWYEKYGKWRARITINGKTKLLGYFDSIEEADNVCKEHRQKLMKFAID